MVSDQHNAKVEEERKEIETHGAAAVPLPKPASDADFYSHEQLSTELWDPHWWEHLDLPWKTGIPPPSSSSDDKKSYVPPPIPPYFDTYHPYACNVCKRCPLTHNTKVFHCSKCQLVKYCSKEHQLWDWKHNQHKRFCGGVSELAAKMMPQDYNSKHDWRQQSHYHSLAVVNAMQLDKTFGRIIMMQPRCRRCYQAQVDGAKLVTCPKCYGVAVCVDCRQAYMQENKIDLESSDDKDAAVDWTELYHPTTSEDTDPGGKPECDGHLLALACSGMIVQYGCPLQATSDADLETTKTTLQTPQTWMEYFALKPLHEQFQNTGVPQTQLEQKSAPVVAFLTDHLALPLTIHAALGCILPGTNNNVNNRKRLVLHILGATSHELTAYQCLIELARMNPHLEYLRVVMFGTTLGLEDQKTISFHNDDTRDDEKAFARPLRKSCDAALIVRCLSYTNERALASIDEEEARQPTLVVALPHAGISSSGDLLHWKKTMLMIQDDLQVPFLYLSWNQKECIADARTIIMSLRYTKGVNKDNDKSNKPKKRLQFLVEPTPNPFRGLRPILDPARDPSDFIYQCAAYAILVPRDVATAEAEEGTAWGKEGTK